MKSALKALISVNKTNESIKKLIKTNSYEKYSVYMAKTISKVGTVREYEFEVSSNCYIGNLISIYMGEEDFQ